MEIIIGRNGQQPFIINDRTVSGKHIKLTTLPDGNVQVEDLGSSNGTFIDGIRILKKVVSRDSRIQLGTSFTFKVSDVITDKCKCPINIVPSNPPITEEFDSEVLRKFEKLESVWQDYQEEKINLQKSNASKGFLRMMPMFVLGGLGYVISCVPELAEYRAIATFAGLGVGAVITWISYKSATRLPEQMEKLNQQFQIDYVCPKCKQFLGFTPFTGLKNKKQCPSCKTKWVKE